MRCFICDRVLSEPQFNADHKDIDPCQDCLDVIQDVLDGYKDKPSASEDVFPDDMHFLLDNLPSP